MYLSRGPRAIPEMSRPQYEYYPAPAQRGPVVNGGLIDFYDNSLQQNQPQQPQYMAAAFPSPVQQQGQVLAPTPSMLMSGAYQQQQPQLFQGVAGVSQAVAPGVAHHLAGQPQVFQAVTPSGQAYISGPPSFLHMNGVTYKPVTEDHPSSGVVQASVKPGEPAPSDAGVRTLSEDEFHQAIREHVESKVDSYMSRQAKLRQHQPPRAGQASAKSHRAAVSSSRKAGGDADEEHVAAMRVQAVNASMRGQSKPTAWQACVNKW